MLTPDNINQMQNQSSFETTSESIVTSTDNRLVNRYRDSYTVARIADTFGNMAKLAGFVCAGIIGFIGLLLTFITVSSFRDSGVAFVVFLISLVIGAIFGSIFYVLGIVLSALGQNLMASLDTAVCSSPFMSREQKIQAMNLTK